LSFHQENHSAFRKQNKYLRDDDMRMERNIRILEALVGMRGMVFILPVMIPFYRDQMGLGFSDFMIAESVFAATIVLCEVPTGWISDIWRRKNTLMLGMAFITAGFGLMAF